MSADAPFQNTLAKPASLAGTALHTGEKVTLTLRPAPVGHGRKFQRKDLPDAPTLDAHIDNVQTVERSTTIAQDGVKVHTVEHILAALAGLGIDNALIEMDANEPPIGDGSARPYVELIHKAGIEPQAAPRAHFDITEPVHLETKNGSLMTIVPSDRFRISCTQMGEEGRFTQFHSTEITPAIFEKEIAPARTFVFYEDVKPLMDKGLIKGGSLESAIVIRGDQVLGKEPLRFKDEFVRHKILDVIGDLSLFPRPLRGHVICVRPGHGPNTDLARILAKQHAKLQALVPPAFIPKGGDVLDINDIMAILPHRYPFLLLDRIISMEGTDKATGIKCVTINEPFFQGHFPGHPVMPGVLQVEAMAQAASILLLRKRNAPGQVGYFMSADKVKFRKPVFPGDTLFIHVEMTKSRRNMGKARCHCMVNNEVVSEGDLMFALIDT